MREETIIRKLYSFDELTEKQQEKAIERLYDLNVDHDWWQSTYEDAERIGLKITGFDLDRRRHATGERILGALEMAYNITSEHGDTCETYATAKDFEANYDEAKATWEEGNEDEDFEDTAESDQLIAEFLNSLLQDYAMILQKEYEYLTSREAIIETIQANEYEFTEDGKLA